MAALQGQGPEWQRHGFLKMAMLSHRGRVCSSASFRRAEPHGKGIGLGPLSHPQEIPGASLRCSSTSSAVVLFAAAYGSVVAATGASGLGHRSRRRVRPGKVGPQPHVPPHISRPPYLGPCMPRSPSHGSPPHGWPIFGEVEIKGPDQIAGMRNACALAREALFIAGQKVAPGVTTEAIDQAVFDFCVSHGAYPSPLGYMGFPKCVSTSVNDVAIHGIPDDRELEDGDIVNIDVTTYLNGYHGDTSCTFIVGEASVEARELCQLAKCARDAGIRVCGPGVPFNEVAEAVSEVVEEAGCVVLPQVYGHGIGSYFHGAPHVPFVKDHPRANAGVMQPGMTFTIEPVVLEGKSHEILKWDDEWTHSSQAGAWSAIFEHTILITEDGREILTGPDVD